MTDLVEVLAVALYALEMDAPDVVSIEQAHRCLTCPQALGEHWGDCNKKAQTCMRCERDRMMGKASAALTALESAGYRVVPVEPTDAPKRHYEISFIEKGGRTRFATGHIADSQAAAVKQFKEDRPEATIVEVRML